MSGRPGNVVRVKDLNYELETFDDVNLEELWESLKVEEPELTVLEDNTSKNRFYNESRFIDLMIGKNLQLVMEMVTITEEFKSKYSESVRASPPLVLNFVLS